MSKVHTIYTTATTVELAKIDPQDTVILVSKDKKTKITIKVSK